MALTDDQQFCLRWNNFQAYITSQFEVLRDDEDFVDVTLACEGQRLGAHKVVLSACSPFFKELFKTNPCPHPIIFMRDVELPHVIALLEFMYAGEVNVAQAHLTGFLKTAESLQIRGLTDASKIQKDNDPISSEGQLFDTNFHEQGDGGSAVSVRAGLRYRQAYQRLRNSPSGTVTSTQDRQDGAVLATASASSPSLPPTKRLCKTDLESDRLLEDADDSTHHPDDELKLNNPFALVQPHSNAGGRTLLHSELDIASELIEPKLELPDYSEEDISHDNSHSYNDASDMHGGIEIVPGTSGMGTAPDVTQDSQQAWDSRKLHSLDPRPCEMCGRVYSNLSNLRQHVRLIHNPTHVQCPVCAKSFKTKLYLKRHLVGCRYHNAKTKASNSSGQAQLYCLIDKQQTPPCDNFTNGYNINLPVQ